MNYRQQYRQKPLQIPADHIRADTCDTRRCTFRKTHTATVQHLRGRRRLHTTPTAHCSLLTANSSYTFSAKEKDSETGLSHFGSRYYSSDLSIWLSVDPMSDKYPSLSPYSYCANNPVKVVDPNGEDYEVVVEGNTITIRAVYYTSSENKAKLQQGLDAWNAQSGVYSYETGKGDNKKTYTINFELTVAEGEYNTATASSAFNSDESGFANFVESSTEIYNENGDAINGEASNNIIHFRPEASTRTMSHEIGHTLGIGDWSLPGPDQEDFGQLMTSGGTSDVINKSHIATILSVKGYRLPSFHSGFTINRSKDFKMETKKAIGIIKKL